MQARKMKETTLAVQAIVFQQLFSSMSPREVSKEVFNQMGSIDENFVKDNYIR